MSLPNQRSCPVLVALDVDNIAEALEIAQKLNPATCRVKIGKQLFTQAGPEAVKALHNLGFDVFLDLKFHDIPNTVAKAVAAAADMGVWMVNVHALGGRKMLVAAAESLKGKPNPPLLIAVTVLTSSAEDDIREVGLCQDKTLHEQAILLAMLAEQSGLDGVVCSAHEAESIKKIREDFITVTPGIRLAGQDAQDQTRIMTPEKALANGSDYLVMGRSIVRAEQPQLVLDAINQLA